jgi:hypothetical protein
MRTNLKASNQPMEFMPHPEIMKGIVVAQMDFLCDPG